MIKPAYMITVTPEQMRNILNGKQKLLVRKTAPKEWKQHLENKHVAPPEEVEVLLYCANGKYQYLVQEKQYKDYSKIEYELETTDEIKGVNANRILNGKVTAKFTLKKVKLNKSDFYEGKDEEFFSDCGMTVLQLFDYIGHSRWYIWHIEDLVIFEEPRKPIKRPPSDWCRCYKEELI